MQAEITKQRVEKLAGKSPTAFWVGFWAKVDESGKCWLWRGSPKVSLGASRVHPAKVAWVYDGRAGGAGETLEPRCGNADCIRPTHQIVRVTQ